MALDNDDNIFVLGHTPSMGHPGTHPGIPAKMWSVRKYDVAGNLLWEAPYTDDSHLAPTAIAVDGSGDIYIGGSIYKEREGQNWSISKYTERSRSNTKSTKNKS